MIFIFRIKIKPALKNKPKITLSIPNQYFEQGAGMRDVQSWFVWSSSKTTEIYTHVSQKDLSKFKNPVDVLFFNNA
jgi:integrase/recombinase XerD